MASFVSGGGGGGSKKEFIVTMTQSSGTYSINKTFSEIYNAWIDEYDVYVYFLDQILYLTGIENNVYATFATLNTGNSSMILYVGSDNSINVETFNPSHLTGTTSNVQTQLDSKVSSSSLSNYMQKGVDYVTAGQASDTTLGTKATAEGIDTTASGNYSHAEGRQASATGVGSHAEGYDTVASENYSHAEGYSAIASGRYSHAEGTSTTAQRKAQHVFGEYNVLDTAGTTTTRGTYVEIVGNGSSTSARSNARTLDWSGNEVLAGKLTVGAAPTADMDVATKKYVDDAIPTVPAQVSKLYTATCPTAAATTAKVATLDDSTGFSLAAGVRVAVTFTYGNTATTPTLNVSSSGAKTIAIPSSATAFTTGSGTTYNTWGAYETVIFTYTGTYWTHLPSGYLGYLGYSGLSSKANTASPALTGTPTAPTADDGTNTTQIATTAFVQNALSGVGGGNWETVVSESINKTVTASKGQNTQVEIIGDCSTKITSSMSYGMYRWVFVGNITGSGAIRLGGSASYYISLVAPRSDLTFITPSFIALYYSSSIGNHYYPASTTVSSSSVSTLSYTPNLTLYTKSTSSSASSITANGTVYLQRAVL